MSSAPFLLGEWRVEPSLNQVTRLARGATGRRITPKAMEVLVVLTARAGDLVSREEILSRVWADVHVQEEVLTRAVADLRKALDDDRSEPRYIETIPKRGYRIIAPVAPVVRKRASRPRLSLWVAGGIAAAAVASVVAWGSRDADLPAPLALETRPLTTLPGREIEPSLSPDGKSVAFAWQGPGGPGAENWDIYVKPLAEETLTRLTDDPRFDLSPTWSPDGSRIAFARYTEGGGCRILEVQSRGGGEREIGSCGKSQNPDLVWSPEGRTLAFSDRESDSESFGIYLLSLDTGEKKKLVAPGGQHWGDKDPTFSPDGKWVVFTRSVSMNTQDLYRISRDGGEPRRVTTDGREVRGASFAPDGLSVIAASARSGNLGLWQFPLGEGRPRQLIFAGRTPRAPEIGSRGELLFEERWRDSDVETRALSDPEGAPEPVVASTQEDREPSLSPDGSHIAFVSSRSGAPEIWVSDLGGEHARRLTSIGGSQVASPAWSPDGRTIVFDARPEGHADLFSVPLEGGVLQPVAPSPANEVAPSFSPDGSEVLFASDRSGTWHVWSSKREEPLTSDGGYVGRLSGDGRCLYFTKFDSPGLHRRDLETGVETALAGTEILADAGAWTFVEGKKDPTGAILFLGVEGGKAHLERLDLASDTVSSLGSVDADPTGGLALDPGGKRVLFTRVVRSESDLVLARLP